MKKVLTFILNHLRGILAIVTFGITAIVIGVVVLSSYTAYQAYDTKYKTNDLAVRSQADADPEVIAIDAKFVTYKDDATVKSNKSGKKQVMNVLADELAATNQNTVTDGYIASAAGKIQYKLTLAETSFVDINFVISSSYVVEEEINETPDLLGNVDFRVNGILMEKADLVLPAEGWQNLAMTGFALPAGDITIEIASKSGKTGYMPNVRNVTIFADKALSVAE